MFAVSTVGTVVGGVGLVFVYRTFRANSAAVQEAIKANQISVEMAQRQSRAYLSVVRCSLLDNARAHRSHSVELVFSNSGSTPATNVRYLAQAVLKTERTADRFDADYNDTRDFYFVSNVAASEIRTILCPAVLGISKEIRAARSVFTADYAESLNIEDFPIVVIKGQVHYDDVFGESFVSNFAFKLHMEQREAYFSELDIETIADKVPVYQPARLGLS